jgi:hypothetical protein
LGDILEEKIAANHLGDIFQKKMRTKTEKCAKTSKFRPIWSHWYVPRRLGQA